MKYVWFACYCITSCYTKFSLSTLSNIFVLKTRSKKVFPVEKDEEPPLLYEYSYWLVSISNQVKQSIKI